jgi:rod shape-determining protein MreC
VSLDSDRAPIDYVRILLFKDFSQLNGLKALQAGPMPPVTTEDPQGRLINTPPPGAPTAPAKPADGAPPPAQGAAAPSTATRPPAGAKPANPAAKPTATTKPPATAKPATAKPATTAPPQGGHR